MEKTKSMNVNDAEVMESEDLPLSTTLSKWPQHINMRPELQKYAESALPASVLLREVTGSIFPVYMLNVRIVGIEPVLTDLFRFVRGHCNHYSCNSTVTDVNWANAGPLLFGKLARPYCPECCQTRRKRYLSLYFHLELIVEDNLGQMLKLVIERDAAVKFFGCTTYRFLVNLKRRLKIKKMLESLLRVSSAPRSAPVPGASFDFRIMPVAIDHTEQVQLHLYGDNMPLFELVKNHPFRDN